MQHDDDNRHGHRVWDDERRHLRTGRFPKNYRRTDERIRDEICDRLASAFDLDPTDVEILVDEGKVVLAGSVPERWMRYQIEHVCAGVIGVLEITNDVRVKTAQKEIFAPNTFAK